MVAELYAIIYGTKDLRTSVVVLFMTSDCLGTQTAQPRGNSAAVYLDTLSSAWARRPPRECCRAFLKRIV